jgi:ParB-like chromosome segregation protein Spo0J
VLHPPAVRDVDGAWVLVAGFRRLQAVRDLGWDRVPVTVVESLDTELSVLTAEGEENTERKAFTPSEMVKLADRIEAVIREQTSQGQRTDLTTSENFSEVEADDRESRTKVAKAVGCSAPTLKKARLVVEAASDPDAPDSVREAAVEALAEMDRTGKVDPAAKKVEKAKRDAAPPPLSVTEILDRYPDIAGPANVLTSDEVERIAGALADHIALKPDEEQARAEMAAKTWRADGCSKVRSISKSLRKELHTRRGFPKAIKDDGTEITGRVIDDLDQTIRELTKWREALN